MTKNKKLFLIDSHAHLQFPAFDDDREEIIKKIAENNFGVINVGSNLENSQKALELAKKHNNFWASVGIHPGDIKDKNNSENFDEEKFVLLLKDEKIAAIGECGLDYSFIKEEEEKKIQKIIFQKQISLAQKFQKPLILHLRPQKSDDAFQDGLEILRRAGFNKKSSRSGTAHFFTAGFEIAREFIDLGFYISFSGVITFAGQYGETVQKTPLDKILVETDCPYAAPVPFRGKRNEPLFARYVAEKIAFLKNLKFEEIAQKMTENTVELFDLKVED